MKRTLARAEGAAHGGAIVANDARHKSRSMRMCGILRSARSDGERAVRLPTGGRRPRRRLHRSARRVAARARLVKRGNAGRRDGTTTRRRPPPRPARAASAFAGPSADLVTPGRRPILRRLSDVEATLSKGGPLQRQHVPATPSAASPRLGDAKAASCRSPATAGVRSPSGRMGPLRYRTA